MNPNELRAEIARKGLSIPKVAAIMGISKKTLYSRLDGAKEFKSSEISTLREVLALTDERMLEIFFEKKVS